MKKIKFLINIIACSIIFSCSSSKKVISDLGVFNALKEKGEFLVLQKKGASLKVDNETLKENLYKIDVPINFKEIKSEVSVLPNKIFFLFPNRQRALILNNKNNIVINKLGVTKSDFIETLEKNNLFNSLPDITMKEQRYYAIKSNEKYLLIYMNVRTNNISKFNRMLESHEIILR